MDFTLTCSQLTLNQNFLPMKVYPLKEELLIQLYFCEQGIRIFKSKDITLPTKVHLVKVWFSSSHVWMWELDCEEGLVLKNWCFWTVVLEKTLERKRLKSHKLWSDGEFWCSSFSGVPFIIINKPLLNGKWAHSSLVLGQRFYSYCSFSWRKTELVTKIWVRNQNHLVNKV